MNLEIARTVPSFRRARRMFQRNLIVYKHGWMIIFSGFFEPLFYLLSIGFGLGAMIGTVDGIPYSGFVLPGLLASSCMNGAVTDGFFNIWFKLHHQKTYEGILATPMRVPDIAFGEMLWAITRGSLYAVAFLTVALLTGAFGGPQLILSWWALAALPAAIFVAASFCSLSLCASSFVRKIQDFDIAIGLVVMPMFLFSGTFFPVSQMPLAIRWLVNFVPLYNAVELLRALTTGRVGWGTLLNVAYLLAMGVIAFVIAMRRFERTLIK